MLCKPGAIASSILFVTLLTTSPAVAQFKREAKPDVPPEADPLQVGLIMSHSINNSSSGDPAFVEFSPDSQILYVAGPIGPILSAPLPYTGSGEGKITDIAQGDTVEDGSAEAVIQEKLARTRPNATAVTAYRIQDRTLVARFVARPPSRTLEEWLGSADLSPDGKYLAGVGGRSHFLYLYDAVTGKVLCCLELTEDRRVFHAECAAFVVVDGTLHVLTREFSKLFLHRIPDGKIVDRIDLTDSKFSYQAGLSATPNGKLFSVGTTVWDATRAELLSYRKASDSTNGQLSPSGSEVLSPSIGRMLRWNRTDEEPRPAFEHVDDLRINSVAVSADERFIAVARSTDLARDKVSIDLFNYKTEAHLRRLEGHLSTVTALAFSPDGKLLASASRDGSTRLWNVAELE